MRPLPLHLELAHAAALGLKRPLSAIWLPTSSGVGQRGAIARQYLHVGIARRGSARTGSRASQISKERYKIPANYRSVKKMKLLHQYELLMYASFYSIWFILYSSFHFRTRRNRNQYLALVRKMSEFWCRGIVQNLKFWKTRAKNAYTHARNTT